MIIIESKRKKTETLLKKYPDAILADVTSKAKDGLVKLSPFYPHYGIPVPFSPGYTATCVEAVWQGLKVFEGCDVDTTLFTNDTMRGTEANRQKIRQAVGAQKGRERQRVVGLYRGSETDIHTHLSVGAGEQGQRHHRPAARGEQDKDHRTARLRHQR